MSALINFRKHLNGLRDADKSIVARIAERLGTSRSQIDRILKGTEPGLGYAEEVANAAGASLASLIGSDAPKLAPTPEETLRLEGIQLLLGLGGDELVLAVERLRKLSRPIGDSGAPPSKKTKPTAG